MAEIRSRHNLSTPYVDNSSDRSSGDSDRSVESVLTTRNSKNFLSLWHWVAIFVFHAAVVMYLRRLDTVYPEVLKSDSVLSNTQFTEGRARKSLEGLVAIGSKPAGSVENEKHAVEYILKELENIKSSARLDVHNFEVDVQSVSGSFSINFLAGFTSVYQNVNNIVVRLTPLVSAEKQADSNGNRGNGRHGNDQPISVMINCHYDTGINSSGASDDGVSCAIMLEVLRVLSVSGTPNKHGVIMVFNGAEENILQASHGFITQHKWAKEIRAFVNLEAAGAGGRELLFQAGPDHPWLVRAYASSAPYPFASVFAQEVFDSGLIPSDTDFRIYRDYGSIPGLDVAYISNGYVYHTKYDQPDQIPDGCIQRGGENLLAVVRTIANSPYLQEPGEYRHGKLVYFDVVGLFMVVYTVRVGNIINVIYLLAVALRLGKRFISPSFGKLKYLKSVLLAGTVSISVIIVSVLAAALSGLCLHVLERRMSWYGNPLLVVSLFMAPALSLSSLCIYVLRRCFYNSDIFEEEVVAGRNLKHEGKNASNLEIWRINNAYFDFYLLLISIPLGILTYHSVGSGVLFMFAGAFPLISRCALEAASPKSGKDISYVNLLVFHSLGMLIPTTFFLYAVYDVLVMFIPIMGRSGTVVPPDLVISIIVTAGFALCFNSFLSLVVLSSSKTLKSVIISSFFLFLTCFLLVLFTPLGFPYKVEGPARQRHIIHHLERVFHSADGSVELEDAGILLLSLDHNGVDYLKDHIPALHHATTLACNHSLPYCGIPFYFPVATLFEQNSYIKTTGHGVKSGSRPQVKVVKKTQIDSHTIQYLLEFSAGPSHMNIYLLPMNEDIDLIGWSVDKGTPTPTIMPKPSNKAQPVVPHYFIYYAYGTAPSQPFQMSIDLRVSEGLKSETDQLIHIAIGSHYLSLPDGSLMTKELEDYIRSIPGWSVPIGWAATYESWIL